MTEMGFLLDLLLNHKLPKPTREALTARIKEVEAAFTPNILVPTPAREQGNKNPVRPQRVASAQSPSTQAILDEKFTPEEIDKMAHGQAVEPVPAVVAPIVPAPPVTPMAAQALQQRQAAITKAVNAGPFGGKPDRGTNSPRKW